MDEREKFQEIIRLGAEINQLKDVDILLERILTETRRLVNADAGSVYLRKGNDLEFSITQNDTQQAQLPPDKKLIYDIFTIPINNASIAGYVANTGESLNIPDVYKLSEDYPFRFNPGIDKASNYRTQSMLTVPMKTHRGDVVGVLQLINAQKRSGKIIAFAKTDVPLIEAIANSAAAALEHAQMTRDIILRMVKMVELNDPRETGGHANRVGAFSAELYEAWARKKGIPREEIEHNRDRLRTAAMLHDIGKIGISDLILKKNSPLTENEKLNFQQHTLIGARLFGDALTPFDQAAQEVALNHHERWDGQGYPGHIHPVTGYPVYGFINEDGSAKPKKGEEIPIFGRVVAIADTYDTLYRMQKSDEEILDVIKSQANRRFDPELVEIFVTIHDVIKSIRKRYKD